VSAAAASVFSTGDPFSELLLQERHDDGSSCMLDERHTRRSRARLASLLLVI